jgi:hypothetical protein
LPFSTGNTWRTGGSISNRLSKTLELTMSGIFSQGQAYGNGSQAITVLPALDLVVAHKTIRDEPGRPPRSVDGLQYHAALLQFITARCGRSCP